MSLIIPRHLQRINVSLVQYPLPSLPSQWRQSPYPLFSLLPKDFFGCLRGRAKQVLVGWTPRKGTSLLPSSVGNWLQPSILGNHSSATSRLRVAPELDPERVWCYPSKSTVPRFCQAALLLYSSPGSHTGRATGVSQIMQYKSLGTQGPGSLFPAVVQPWQMLGDEWQVTHTPATYLDCMSFPKITAPAALVWMLCLVICLYVSVLLYMLGKFFI